MILKVGILGGTGNMGRGLAVRWAVKHDVLLGSRSIDRAIEVAKDQEKIARGFYQAEMQGSITGGLNLDVVGESNVVVVALPATAVIQTLTQLNKVLLPNQVFISTVVAMKKSNGLFTYAPLTNEDAKLPQGKSAAEIIQDLVKPTPVVSAFQTVPAGYLNNLDSIMNIDILVAGDNAHAIDIVSGLILDIPNLRPLKVGPLSNSKLMESLTPLLLNAAVLNKLREPAIRIVPWMPKSFQ
jgi:NADPH-dependent F420 reductase